MFKGTLVFKEAGHLIPKAFLERVISDNKSLFSAAVVDADEGLCTLSEGAAVPIDKVQKIQETFKDVSMFMCFGNNDNPLSEENLQPYVLLTSDTEKDDAGNPKPRLVAFLEGPFLRYEEPQSSFTNDYHAYTKYLSDRFEEMFAASGKDMAQLLERLKKDSVIAEFENFIAPEGHLALLADTGDTANFSIGKSELLSEQWGWTTRHHGYGQSALGKAANKLAGAIGKVIPTKAQEPAKVVEPEPAKAEPEPVKTDTAPAPKVETALEYPPPGMTQKNLKKWYRARNNGVLPQDESYKTGKLGMPPLNKSVKSMADLPQLSPKLGEVKKDTTILENKKSDTAPKHIAATTPISSHVQIGDQMLPVLNNSNKDAIAKIIQAVKPDETIDLTKIPIIEPKTIETLESKYPSFTQQAGMKDGLAELAHWRYENFRRLVTDTPDGAAVLLFQLRNAYLKQHAKIGQLAVATDRGKLTGGSDVPANSKVAASGGGKKLQLPM